MKIAVIGAGISGLAAGYKLQKLGHDVTIYEASDRPGGRGQLLNRPGTEDWADVGSQYFHSNYKIGMKLIHDLGLDSKLKTITGKTRMITGKEPGESYTLSPHKPWIKPGGFWGNLKVALYAAKLLLKHRSHTFAADASQAIYDQQSALGSTDSRFVRDHVPRMLNLVGGLSEPDVANVNLLQIHRLFKIIMLTDYVSLEGGTATLHGELARRLDIRFNSPVSGLIEKEGVVRGLTLETGEDVQADHVVVAAHAPRAAALVPSNWKQEKAYLSNIDMSSAILVSLFLDKPLEKGVWTYFLPFEDKGAVSFCVDTQQKSPGNTPSGKATLQAWIINPNAAALIDKSDEELAAIVRRDIAPYLPEVDNSIEDFAVTRHRHAVPQSTVGHNKATLEFLDAIDSREGVSFCGDYMSGGYMESALWSVERAVKKITDRQSLKLAA